MDDSLMGTFTNSSIAADAEMQALKDKLTEAERELRVIKNVAACGSVQSFLELSDKDKAVWFALAIDDSVRRKKAEQENEELREQLAASQAREAKLREGLENIVFPPPDGVVLGGISRLRDIARMALALPQDDTALREWGAKLLREMAVIAEGETWSSGFGYDLHCKADELEGR